MSQHTPLVARQRSLATPTTAVAAAVLSLLTGTPLLAQEWPQFLGPHRDGVYAGPALTDGWPEDAPAQVWTKRIGAGFAGPVVADGRLILFHRVRDSEVVEALDPLTGRTQWNREYVTSYRDDFGFDPGPRSVPVVVDGRVFTFGAQGRLHALDFDTGEVLWDEDTRRRFEVRKGFFGAAGSPLVSGGRVLANVGGPEAGIVAFDAETGDLLWTATGDEASYSSPVEATFDGEHSAVFFTRNGLVAVDPATGSVRFEQRWRSRIGASVNAATPLIIDDLIFLSSSYGTGAVTLRVSDNQLTELWASDDVMSNHYATAVHHDGYLYGFHGRQEYSPSFRAVELRTGRVRWSEDRFGAGTVTLVGDRLLIMRETGELLIAEASPDAFRLVASAQVIDAPVRAYPALANGYLYVRNTNTLICLDLRP